jgi:RNA polymerase sigma-70 factor (ECF subfamily)
MSKATDWNVPREVAVPRLLDLHGGRLYALGRQLCGDPHEAQDLVQEIFVQAWRKWDQFDARSDPIYWLFTIARRACQRMHRKRAGEPARMESLDELLPFGEPKMAVVPAGAADEEVRRERQETVGAAIAALPNEFRMALILKDIVGFRIEEVAGILGIKAATVKTRVHRARLRLRKALESGLPRSELPPVAYSRQICLDLLQAKQHSLDRGVEMPNANEIICHRCAALFATLDLTRNVCSTLGTGELPAAVRAELLANVQREAG